MNSATKLTRRRFLAGLSAGAASLGVMGMSKLSSNPAKKRKKLNILYIMTDQQPVSCVGAFGNEILKTPNLDALAASGCKLPRTFVSAFPCCPSRASQLTGRYAHNHGVVQNDLILDADVPCLGTICGNAGYETGYFGKWHLGGWVYPDTDFHPTIKMPKWYMKRIDTPKGWKFEPVPGGLAEDSPQHGFKTWAGGWKQYHQWLKDKGQGHLLEKHKILGCHDIAPSADDDKHAYSLIHEDYHVEAFIAEQTSNYINNQKDSSKPWCAVLSFYGPHMPVAPPKPGTRCIRLTR